MRGFPGIIIIMADNTHYIFLSVLRLDRLTDFLLNTLQNYVPPVEIGFFCSDTSIRHPYSPDDTVSILSLIVILPLLIMILHQITITWVFTRPIGHDSIFQRLPVLVTLVGGVCLTALLTAYIKLATGRLAPNFYDGCKPGENQNIEPRIPTCNRDYNRDDYITEFTCFHPERLREVSRSFPCIYTSLSSFSWFYLVIWVYTLSAPSFTRTTRTLAIAISLVPPIFVAFTRLHDNKSHLRDVIAGWMLGMLIAGFSAIGSNIWTRCKSDQNIPQIRVCSSALLANIEGFIDELRSRFDDVVDDIVHEQLPYNDLDAFSLDAWHKNDVIILCHSIDNRMSSLTNVKDAQYDKFIPKVSKFCGKDSLIVIVHDYKCTRDQTRMNNESTLRANQATTIKYAGNVLLAGKLGEEETYDGLRDQDWEIIQDVLSNWSN